jgi:hypothetical protein
MPKPYPPPTRRTRSFRAFLALACAAAAFARAGETWGMVGSSYGAFRYHPRKVFLSLELDHKVGSSPFGFWTALEGKEGTGQYLGFGPLAVYSPSSDWKFAVSSGPGYYHRQEGLDLGYQVEFRSSAYVAHRIGGAGWLGISVSHYSNAHLRPGNPGAETLRVFWSIPLSSSRAGEAPCSGI